MHPTLPPLPTRRHTTAAALLALALATSFASAQSGTLTSLIVTGQPLTPGAPVETLLNISNLIDISPSGRVLYHAAIGNSVQGAASDFALMSVGAGQPRTIFAREAQVLPRGGTLSAFASSATSITSTHRIVSRFTLSGPSASTLVSVDNGVLTEIVRNSDILTGTTTFGVFGEQVAFDPDIVYGVNTLAGPSVTVSNDTALLRHRAGQSVIIVREGDSNASGGTFGGSFAGLTGNDSGYFFFRNTLVGVANPTRIFRYQNVREEVVAEGTPVPTSGTLTSFSTSPSSNTLGQIAFYNVISGTTGGANDNEGIYRAIPGELIQIARKGQAAPGGGTLSDISTTVQLNNSGRVAFVATQSDSPGGTFDGDTIFTGTGGSLTRLARIGQAYAPSGGTEVITLLQLSSYNDAGVALLSAQVSVPGSGNLDVAVFLTDGIESVEVLRSGQSFSGSTITSISTSGGSRRLLPDGRVINQVSLADSRQTILEFVPSLRYRSTFSSSWDTASNWTLSLPPSAFLPVRIDPSTSLTITGPTGTESVLSLQVGGGNGNATLRLAGGNLSTTNGTTILPNGFLTGDGSLAGPVLNQGTITPTLISFPDTLTNAGLVRGSTTGATLNGPLLNQPAGTLRIQAGESLNLGGPVTNSGRIDAFGNATSVAEVTFASTLTNSLSTGLISARNAQLRFNGGLTNRGSLALTSGINDVSGDINNIAGATLTVTGGAHTTFYDDVTQNGTLRVVKSGSTTSVAVFLGAFSGAGGATGGGDIFLEGDLRPGNSPAFVNFDANLALGPNSTTLIEIAGTADASYDRVTVNGILNLAGTLDVRFIDGFLPTGNAPATFLILSATTLTGDFSQTLLPTAGDRQWFLQRTATSLSLSSFNVIPEPTSLALLALPTLTLLRWQRRSR